MLGRALKRNARVRRGRGPGFLHPDVADASAMRFCCPTLLVLHHFGGSQRIVR